MKLNFRKWSPVLEVTLQYTWTNHAKIYTYSDRKYSPKAIEELVLEYSQNNPDIQECESRSNPNIIVIQKKIDSGLVLRVAIDKEANPWTVVTYYLGSYERYWRDN